MWTEFKIATDYATGMTEPTRGTIAPPAGFVLTELGFGLDGPDPCGPACRCTALRPAGPRRARTARLRTGRQWQALVATAAAAARAA